MFWLSRLLVQFQNGLRFVCLRIFVLLRKIDENCHLQLLQFALNHRRTTKPMKALVELGHQLSSCLSLFIFHAEMVAEHDHDKIYNAFCRGMKNNRFEKEPTNHLCHFRQ